MWSAPERTSVPPECHCPWAAPDPLLVSVEPTSMSANHSMDSEQAGEWGDKLAGAWPGPSPQVPSSPHIQERGSLSHTLSWDLCTPSVSQPCVTHACLGRGTKEEVACDKRWHGPGPSQSCCYSSWPPHPTLSQVPPAPVLFPQHPALWPPLPTLRTGSGPTPPAGLLPSG